jgi:hypothetical protein
VAVDEAAPNSVFSVNGSLRHACSGVNQSGWSHYDWEADWLKVFTANQTVTSCVEVTGWLSWLSCELVLTIDHAALEECLPAVDHLRGKDLPGGTGSGR